MCCILYACSMCCICTARHIEKFVLYVAQRSCTANIAWHAPCETHAGSLRNQLVLTGLGKVFEATVCIVVQSHVQPPGDHHTHTHTDVLPPIVCKLPLPMMLETVLPHSSLHCETVHMSTHTCMTLYGGPSNSCKSLPCYGTVSTSHWNVLHVLMYNRPQYTGSHGQDS